MSKFTKLRIMDTFLELLNKKSLDKLTVKDIIETAEVNRNTFYYYFEDIYDLLHEVFKKQFKDFCDETKKETFYEEYIRAADFIMKNRHAMEHVYKSKDRDLIRIYIERVARIFVERFVREAAVSYDLSEEGIEYLTGFYSNAITGNTMHWVEEGMPPYREKVLFLISKSFEATVDDMIKTYIEFGECNME